MLSTKKNTKFFTLEEANRSLVLIRPILTDVFSCLSEISHIKEQHINSNRVKPTKKNVLQLQKNQNQLVNYLQELNSIGVIMTDLIQGTIDFPTIYNYKKTYFCWKPSEAQISFYHENHCSTHERIYLSNLTSLSNTYGNYNHSQK